MNCKDKLLVQRLSPDMIDTAIALCDEYVGENMYSFEEISAATDGDKSFFFMLYDKNRVPIGYTYFLLMDKKEFLQFSKLDRSQFDSLGLPNGAVIGNLRSLAIVREYRGQHYAKDLFGFSVDFLRSNTKADIAAGVLWKMGEEIPMKKVFEEFSFFHLADTELVWYDKEDMYCPYCKGRCVCGASVYYKNLEAK